MKGDRLAKHRKPEERERKDIFDRWLSANCHDAVSHDKLRHSVAGKEKKIAHLLEK